MEARWTVRRGQCIQRIDKGPTLEEFLACILLEECFMEDRAVKVVDHQPEHRLDVFFIVSRIVSKCGVLGAVSTVSWARK